jgi:hypothetical protein
VQARYRQPSNVASMVSQRTPVQDAAGPPFRSPARV